VTLAEEGKAVRLPALVKEGVWSIIGSSTSAAFFPDAGFQGKIR
jgi:hypothetical protein